MSDLLKDKTAIITGSNRGIGRAILQVFAENGATIFACARKKDDEFERDIKQLEEVTGSVIYPIYFDLCNSEEIKKAVKEIRNKKLSIDILVNNAGILSKYQLRFTMLPIDQAKKLFEIDFFAQMEFTQFISRIMQKDKKGSIIYLSSIAGIDAFFSSYDYVACKAAIIGAMKQQAREFGRCKIRVNSVAPGIIETDMIAVLDKDTLNSIKPAVILERFGTAREVANTVLFLASDLSSYITGQVIRVDGGTSPPKADW